MDLNKLITGKINEHALDGDADLLDNYSFLFTIIAKEHLAEQLRLYGVVGRSEQLVCDVCHKDDMVVICKKCNTTLIESKNTN